MSDERAPAVPSAEHGPWAALIRPPVVLLPGSLATHGPTPPIGLAYIAAALRDAGRHVQVVDGAGEGIDRCVELQAPVGVLHRVGLSPVEIVERIEPSVRFVGITNMFLHEWPQVRELAVLVKERLPRAVVVLGGENATAFSDWILADCGAIDCCVLGEGEATVVGLADRVAGGRSLAGLAGVASRDEATGEVANQGLPVRISKQALGEVGRPAWDLIPLEKYWAQQPFFGVNRGRSMQVLGTRGCPYRCSFCSSPQMWTTKYVVREPEDVVDEIISYVDRYGVENINFVDLTAATNRRWTVGLCDAMERRAPGVTWQLPVGTRIEGIDREVLRRLSETGCRNITFAPETGSERMLEVMNKRADLDHILRSVREAHEVGLRTTVNIIVGHPDERWSDVRKSIRFLAKAAWAGGDDTAVIMFCPYPGSADFDRLVAEGRHVIDEEAFYVGLSRSSSAHRTWNDRMSSRQLRALQLAMILGFYAMTVVRRPRRIIEFLRAQRTGREDTYLDQMVRTRRRAMKAESPTAARAVPESSRSRPAVTLVHDRGCQGDRHGHDGDGGPQLPDADAVRLVPGRLD